MKTFFYLIFFVLQAMSMAQAKEWRNAYISFEIPNRWKCVLEQTEWVCRSDDQKESKESIIILTAKEVGPIDSMALYEGHLTYPISVPVPGGGGIVFSKPFKKPEYIQIKGLKWIDGFHLSSEIPNYFTRYLATIKDKIAVLVTFSAHKDEYARYSADFNRAVQSLNVIAAKETRASRMDGIRDKSESLFQAAGPETLPAEPTMMNLPLQKKDKSLYWALALILAAIGLYIFYKSQKR